ncbi:MAG: transglycosylase SLT domain-containing protein [Verrucomicrobiota bacterium]|nr:transglycosylase SLT domain-containing protein [Verrucomicrobiota bacterium]
MTKHIAVLALLVLAGSAVSAESKEWRPPEKLLKAVRYIESSHGQFTYGDNGRSLGDFQISEAAWVDVSAYRKSRGLKVYSYEAHVYHPFINRAYASDYLSMIHSELKKKLGRAPTAGEIYAAYNMGLANFAECNYSLSRVNRVTAKKAREITTLLAKAD